MKELIVPEFQELEKTESRAIEKDFKSMIIMIEEMEKEFDEIVAVKKITPETSKSAKSLRLRIAKTRGEADKLRKLKKKKYLIKGNAIQGFYNVFVGEIFGFEEKLKEIEKHAEIIAQKKKDKLIAERSKKLEKYNVENIENLALGEMAEDVFINFLEGTKTSYENKIKAEKEAEEQRIAQEKADREEQERIMEENEKLKKEAEERDRLEQIEEAKRQKIEDQRLEKEQKEREMRERELEAERAEARKKQEAIEATARVEREARERLEAEAEAKREEELRLKIEAENYEKENVENQEKARKNERFKKFLSDNSFDKTTMEVRQKGSTFTIWEKKATITI